MKKIICLFFIIGIQWGCDHSKNDNSQIGPIVSADSDSDSLIYTRINDTINIEDHSMIMDLILGKPKKNIKEIGILVYDGVNDLDFIGPRYVFGQVGAKVRLIGLKTGTFKTVMGLEVRSDTVIDSIDKLDILIIPGGFTGTIEAAYNEKVLNWIRKIDQNTLYTASVCTGGWVLGASGLLKGKKATTNWYKEEEFLKKYGAIKGGERYSIDGKYWTSAGVTAGMDMSLAIVMDNWGPKYAQGIMLDMEYDPAPPLNGGTPEKTNWLVRWMMNSMYDAGVNPLIDSLENISKQQIN